MAIRHVHAAALLCLAAGSLPTFPGGPPRDRARYVPLPRLPHQGIGRNAPCSCGSGKKFKRCCLRT